MKIPVPIVCNCGSNFSALGYGELTFPPSVCPECGETIHILDPLTPSLAATRLLYRAQAELEGGDYSMPIILGAMTVEAAMTALYMKWRCLKENLLESEVTQAHRDQWEDDYCEGTKKSGFVRSANFISSYLTGVIFFDDFVTSFVNSGSKGQVIAAGLPPSLKHARASYIQGELFNRRNRIMHWGQVNHSKDEAANAVAAARTAFAVLLLMDKTRAAEHDKELRART